MAAREKARPKTRISLRLSIWGHFGVEHARGKCEEGRFVEPVMSQLSASSFPTTTALIDYLSFIACVQVLIKECCKLKFGASWNGEEVLVCIRARKAMELVHLNAV